MAFGPSHAAEPPAPPPATGLESYIVVFKSAQIGPAAAATTKASQSAAALGVKPTHTYTHAVRGYAARLSPAQVDAVRATPTSPSSSPTSRSRPRRPSHRHQPDVGPDNANLRLNGQSDAAVDADVAVVDTGADLTTPTSTWAGVACIGGTCPAGRTTTATAPTCRAPSAQDDGNGVVGVAPGARIVPVKV